MNYLLFNNEIFISDGQTVKKIEKGSVLNEIEKARLCCVDVDVMIASAPQDYLDKKDSLLAKKFGELYPDEYIIQDEKIDNNIFQVIGIKSRRVKEIYALIPSTKVDAFVPYAVSLRSFLVEWQTDMSRSIVFVDDLGQEKLITVFEGLKFSRTRTIYTDKAQDILSDIKRSHIDFNKKLGDFIGHKSTGDFTLVTNNSHMADAIKHSEPDLSVEFLDSQFPALEGLKHINSGIKYRMREDIIREREKYETGARIRNAMISAGICVCGALFLGFNQIKYSYAEHVLEQEEIKHDQFQSNLNQLDQLIYRDSIKRSKDLNYAGVYFELINLLPVSYEISSFKFIDQGNDRSFDAYIFSKDGEFFDQIPRSKILRNALIKDFYVQDRPGKYLRIEL